MGLHFWIQNCDFIIRGHFLSAFWKEDNVEPFHAINIYTDSR